MFLSVIIVPVNGLQILEAKLERADEHIDKVDAAVEAFLKSEPYRIIVDEKSQPAKRIYGFDQIIDIPMSIPILAGEVLYQLRSTLDHLVWQMVLAAGNTPTRATAFPIANDSTEYESPKCRRKVNGVPDRAKKLIDDIEPYHGGNEDLWLLGKLNNVDKHRLLLAVGSYNTARTTTPEDHARLMQGWVATPVAEAIEQGFTLLAHFRSTPRVALKQGHILYVDSSPEPNKYVGFEFNVAFSEPEIIRVEPPGLTLKRMWNAVSWVVSDLSIYL